MRKLISILCLSAMLVGAFVTTAFGQAPELGDIRLQKGWSLGMINSVPVFKIVESADENVKADVVPILGLCGGLCFYYTDDKSAPNHERMFSISPLAVMLTSRLESDGKFDPSVGGMIGFFDDAIQIGWMYFLGLREPELSRHELIFSLGFSL